MTRRHPIKITYRGCEFTVSDFGDRMARYGSVDGFKAPDMKWTSMQRADGWLARTPEKCIRKVLCSIDEHMDKKEVL